MSAKELIAELKMIKQLTQDDSIKAICDILADLVKAIDKNKPQFGFGDSEK